jgi:cyclopropane-fatty-acyl-phospholipid synthase
MHMHMAAAVEQDQDTDATLRLLDEALGTLGPRDFAVRLWDGSTWGPGPGQAARFTLVLRDPGVIRHILGKPSSINVGEAYIYDDFDVEGDIEHLFTVGERILADPPSALDAARVTRRLFSLPGANSRKFERAARLRGRAHSPSRDRQAIAFHYDVSNEFYSLWLDDRMVYSCAYFESPDDDLDTAQERKLDLICRKLRLQPGERILDIGCGWAGLLIHAVSNYGVEGLGITLSERQADLANERMAAAGIADRCRVEIRDYRDVQDWNGFDKIVSVGMFEHVGKAKLEEYFQHAYGLLKPGGQFLNHGIATSPVRRAAGTPTFDEEGPSFIDRYVFPDGELVPLNETLSAAETAGFDVRDVESLREHYALTLRHWVANLERRHEEVRAATDEATYRIWRAYMAASAFGFDAGYISVYQTLLAKADAGRAGLPLTRADWYAQA